MTSQFLECYLRGDYRWIAGKISDILGNEDDVVIELCFNLLEGSRNVRMPQCPRAVNLIR